MTFIISRAHWIRGTGEGNGVFTDQSGNYDALGHVLHTCGIPDAVLGDLGSITFLPDDLIRRHAPHGLFEDLAECGTCATELAMRIANVNDDDTITDAEREEALIRLFILADIAVRFED